MVSAVNGNDWRQEWYETGDPSIKARARGLRRLNVRVTAQSMGRQITESGAVKMTLLDIRRGDVDECVWDRVIAR